MASLLMCNSDMFISSITILAGTDAISKVVEFACHFVTYIVIALLAFALATL